MTSKRSSSSSKKRIESDTGGYITTGSVVISVLASALIFAAGYSIITLKLYYSQAKNQNGKSLGAFAIFLCIGYFLTFLTFLIFGLVRTNMWPWINKATSSCRLPALYYFFVSAYSLTWGIISSMVTHKVYKSTADIGRLGVFPDIIFCATWGVVDVGFILIAVLSFGFYQGWFKSLETNKEPSNSTKPTSKLLRNKERSNTNIEMSNEFTNV